MFVDAGVDKIRLTGGEVCIPRTLLSTMPVPDEREFRACPFWLGLEQSICLVAQGAAWNGDAGVRLGS